MVPIPKQMIQSLIQAQRLLFVAHVSPDGDTLGSNLALCLSFLSLGKNVTVVCQDDVPEIYAFLPGIDRVRKPESVSGEQYDVAVAVDVSDSLRLGSCKELYDAQPIRMVVDHHPTNDNFGQINWIMPEAAATGVMVLSLIKELGVALDKDIATCLYVAISTDTGHFEYANTNGSAMRAAAELVDTGISVNKITRHLYHDMPLPKMLLLSRALYRMRFEYDGLVAYIPLRHIDFIECGASEEMTEGIINYALEIRGVQIAFMATERSDGIKFSMRAKHPYNVASICQKFGGGGHVLAAGCKISDDLDCAVKTMLLAIEESRSVKA